MMFSYRSGNIRTVRDDDDDDDVSHIRLHERTSKDCSKITETM